MHVATCRDPRSGLVAVRGLELPRHGRSQLFCTQATPLREHLSAGMHRLLFTDGVVGGERPDSGWLLGGQIDSRH